MRGVRSLLSWVLTLFIAVMFLIMADAKLFTDPAVPNTVFSIIAERTEIPLFEPTGRFMVGLAELLAVLLLLLPFTRRLGAFLALVIAGAAVGFHLSPYLGQEIPIALNAAETDGGSLFYLAMALTAASGLLFFIHPGPRRKRL